MAGKTKFIVARITADQKDALQAKAIERRIKISVLIREMIAQFLHGQNRN